MKYPYTGKRAAACLIDYTLIYALTIFYIVYFGEEDSSGQYSIHGFATLLPVTLWFVYFVVAETFGGTLGHRIFKLKVISMDRQPLTFGRILVRRLCDVVDISFCFGLIAFILVKNTQFHQRLGDIAARTQVVGKEDLAPSVDFDFEKNITAHPHQG